MYARFFKRFFDIILSLVVLTFLCPVMVVISLVLTVGGGHVIYSHLRVGQHGKPFKTYKFRTMVVDAELKLAGLLESDPNLKREWSAYHKLSVDPRETRMGTIFRRYKLDELPQFFNVLSGEMSIVGPRPLTSSEFDLFFPDEASVRLYQSVRPGITGAWASGPACNYDDRIAKELEYVRSISLLFDVKILHATLFKIVKQ